MRINAVSIQSFRAIVYSSEVSKKNQNFVENRFKNHQNAVDELENYGYDIYVKEKTNGKPIEYYSRRVYSGAGADRFLHYAGNAADLPSKIIKKIYSRKNNPKENVPHWAQTRDPIEELKYQLYDDTDAVTEEEFKELCRFNEIQNICKKYYKTLNEEISDSSDLYKS